MRNLKKILALVLSLAMIMSMTAFAGFADADKVDADYAEAVTVLNGMGVFKGYTDGSFKPQGEITRAEVAAIVYRIATADVDDDYVDLWTGTAKFADVNDAAWYAGYVGFCASNGYVQGYPDGTFKPEAKVTGFEVLAMILRVNGYDAEKEFSGIKWSDNIAKVATQNDILEDVKPGALAKAAPREMVAQLLFGALNAPTVNYTLLNGYTKNKTTLGGEKFGLKLDEDYETDDFGRPAYAWKYNTGNKKSVFAEEALATYTEAAKNCDIKADTGLKTGKELDVYKNGVKDDPYTIADNTKKEIGAQGQLVEFYSDRVVVIDTYLAEITKAVAEKTDSRGHVTDAYVKATVYEYGEDPISLEYETDEFAKGDMVLVTIADGDIQTMEDAPYEVNVLTKIAGNKKTIKDIQDVMGIDKADATVNHTAVYAPETMTLGNTYGFYYDTYGNVIGAEVLGTNYAVLDKLYIEHNKGVDTAYGTVYFFDGENDSDVVIDEVDGDDVGEFEITSSKNEDYYYTVYAYSEKDGVYTLDDSDFDYIYYGEYRAGSKYMIVEGWDEDEEESVDKHLQLSKNSQILLQTTDSPNGKFTAYTGYEDLPSFEGNYVQYTVDANGYVDMLYAYAYEFSSRTVFVYDTKPITSEIDANGNTIATMNVLELVDGEMKDTTVDVYYDLIDEDEAWGSDINAIGLYEITEGEDGIWYAISQYKAYTIEKVTNDGKRVEINGRYADLDDAEIVKYVGTWVCGDTDLDWTTKDLIADGDAFGYVQYDEDGKVVAVYDLFIKVPVTVDEEQTKDVEYLGRDFKTVTVDLAEYEMIDSAKMYNMRNVIELKGANMQDIELTVTYFDKDGEEIENFDEVKGTKVDYAEISYDGNVTGAIEITTCNQAAYTNAKLVDGTYGFTADKQSAKVENAKKSSDLNKITVKDDNDTVTVSNLKALLEAEALGTNFQSIKIYDTNEAEVATGNLADDMYVKVTAWDGKTTAIYQIVVEAGGHGGPRA